MNGLLSSFSLSGLSTALARATALGHEGELRRAFWLSIKWSVFMSTGFLGVALYYFANHNTTLGISFLIGGAFAPFINAGGLFSSFLNGKKLFREASLYGIFRNGIPAAALFLALILTKNAVVLIAVYFISYATVALILYIQTYKRFAHNTELSSTMVSLSRHLSAINLFGAFAGQIGSVLIFHMIGAAELAVYSFAIAIPTQIEGVLRILQSLAIPKFAVQDKNQLRGMVIRRSLSLSALVIFIVIGYVLLVPFFFQIFFPRYFDAVPFSQVFAISLVFANIFTGAYMDSQIAVRERYIINAVCPLFLIASLFFLIPLYGVWGAVWAQVAAALVEYTLCLILVKWA